MLCRGMQELRELVCQSRLDYRGSDSSDVESDELSDTRASGNFDVKFAASLRVTSSDSFHTATPDSGLAGSLTRCGSTSDSDPTESLADGSGKNRLSSSQLKRPVVPSVRNVVNPVPAAAEKSKTLRCTTEEFAIVFDRINRKLVARWLEDVNAVISQLSRWCQFDDNYIAFGHFWLSEFAGTERGSLVRMEHGIFVERLASAFSSDVRLFHVAALADAVLHEFPRRLLSVEGPRRILHWLDVLTSPKRSEQWRQTFASVHCSTTCHQHSEVVLSLRAFALVSLVSAFVDFYQKLLDNHLQQQHDGSPPSAREVKTRMSEEHMEVSERRMCASIRKGFADVVHFLIKSGRVSAGFVDTEQRSLVFLAVLHRRSEVLNLLLTHVICRERIDVNRAAANGNTPLHVAVGFGDERLVEMLLSHARVDVSVSNLVADGATPLHLAVMHGYKGVVSRLLAAGADPTLTANGQAPLDIAREFELTDVVDLLTAHATTDRT